MLYEGAKNIDINLQKNKSSRDLNLCLREVKKVCNWLEED